MKTNLHTQDFLNYLEKYITTERKQKFIEVLNNRTKFLTVVLEDVYQLHNTSAVLRSCDVFGVQDVYVVEERFGKKIEKEIALGAQKWVNVHRFNSTQTCIDSLRKSGYQILATSPHIESHTLDDYTLTKPTAFFFGTEKMGISKEVEKLADGFIKIPMVGFSESLNISVSASILLEKMTSQLRKSNLNWQLSENDKFELILDWTKKSVRNLKSLEADYIKKIK